LKKDPRPPGRNARVIVAQRAVTEVPDPDRPALELDFTGRRVSAPTQAPRTNETIKQAIIRWLEGQL
jgi:hypothetical protein